MGSLVEGAEVGVIVGVKEGAKVGLIEGKKEGYLEMEGEEVGEKLGFQEAIPINVTVRVPAPLRTPWVSVRTEPPEHEGPAAPPGMMAEA